ncbi:MAG TPA: D-glycerate dehydrogenase [Planctomycetota bacterium]|jgi:glyoxylate reductase|nr:D-glycerate dehydrogenase [Planctomycetota bacterium]
MPDVFVTAMIPTPGLDLLKKAFGSYAINATPDVLPKSKLIAALKTCDAVLATPNDLIDAEVIEAGRGRLKIISNIAVGYNNIDVAAATAANIHVCNTPGVLTETTADLAWALLLAAARRVPEGERQVRAGRWEGLRPLQFLGVDIYGRTLGIVGAGRIGTAVARRGLGFGMKILYTARKQHPEMDAIGGQRLSLLEVLARSDFVSLHVPLTPETMGLIGAKELALMKPTAVLVNTARGAVIKEADLAAALADRKIFAAGLDVYENEPNVPPALCKLENVVLAPHIGSATLATRERMSVMAAENIIAVLQGRRPPHGVNTDALAAAGAAGPPHQ